MSSFLERKMNLITSSFSASGKRAADVLLLTKSEESSLKPKLSQSPQTQVKRPRVADLESGDEGVEEKEMVQDDKECNNEAAEVGAAAEDEENENEKTGSVDSEEEQENAADHVEEVELEGEQAEESCIVQDFHDYQDKMRALMENVKNIFSEVSFFLVLLMLLLLNFVSSAHSSCD